MALLKIDSNKNINHDLVARGPRSEDTFVRDNQQTFSDAYQGRSAGAMGQGNIMDINDMLASGTNENAQVYLPALKDVGYRIKKVHWGYDSTPTAGALIIESPSGTTFFHNPITVAGYGYTYDIPPVPNNQDVNIKIKSGGSGITGYINVIEVSYD